VYGYTGTIQGDIQRTSGQVREEDPASVYKYAGTQSVRLTWKGNTDTPWANNAVELKRVWVGQAREEDAASVSGNTEIPEQTIREPVARPGRRMRRVYSQRTNGRAREEDAASMFRYTVRL
jgi:hypothetical protein